MEVDCHLFKAAYAQMRLAKKMDRGTTSIPVANDVLSEVMPIMIGDGTSPSM
jgi:hypothetical protein